MHLSTQEFRALGLALFGPGWQTEMARRLDVLPRTVRRWAAGDTPVPDWVPLELGVTRDAANWPRDEWVLGFGDETDLAYIMHTREPRFIARVVPEGEAADLGGVTTSFDGGEIRECVWLDPCPPESELVSLMREAALVAEANGLPLKVRDGI